jgi:hypothetical protein
VSSLANLRDPKKRDLFAQDVAYEVAEMESPVTVTAGECTKEALVETAKAADNIAFNYDNLISRNNN